MRVDGQVLIRKMRQGGVARSPLADTVLVGDVFARGAEDCLRALVKCPVAAHVHECRVARLGDATAEIGTPAMIGLLALDRSDAQGIVALDSTLAAHLLDLALGGDPADPAPVTVRAFTGVDTAICRLALDALARSLGDALAASLGRPLPRPLRLAEQRHAIAHVRIAPDYVDVLKLRLDLTLGEGGRTGRLDVALPLSALDVLRAAVAREGAADARDRPDDLWRTAMRRAAAGAPVVLDAVIHRERMPLAAVEALAPGQVIEIDPDAPQRVALTLAQPGGRSAILALAQLGAYRGRKVVRLAAPPEPRLGAHLRRALRCPAALPEPEAPAAAEPARLPPPEEAPEAAPAPEDQPAS